MARARIEVNLEELDQVLEEARQAPLSEDRYQKLKTALHALAEWARSRSTEKTKAVLGEVEDRSPANAVTTPDSAEEQRGKPVGASPGHGRNGAEAFQEAKKVEIAHPKLKHGDRCPGCGKGNVYRQKEARTLVRIVGQAPLDATLYELPSNS
jgi:transposase